MRIFAIIIFLCPIAFGAEELIDSDLSSQGGIPGLQITKESAIPKCSGARNPEIDKPIANQRLSAEDENRIRALMDERSGQIQVRYQRELRSNPCAFGAIKLQVELTDSGTPAKVSYVAENKNMEAVAEKVVPIVMGIDFGSSLGGATFGYTINFFREWSPSN